MHYSTRFPVCGLLAVMPPLLILGALFLLPRRPGGSPNMASDPVGALLYFGIVILCVLGGLTLAFVSLARREHPQWLA
jgi:hypothetical protein